MSIYEVIVAMLLIMLFFFFFPVDVLTKNRAGTESRAEIIKKFSQPNASITKPDGTRDCSPT